MGCAVSKTDYVKGPKNHESNSNLNYYKNQSLGSFNREIILCGGCNKCFNIGSNQIKLNCGICHKFFHCNIAGECMGNNCLFTIGDIAIRARYCNDCSVNKGDNKCICNNCI